MSKFFASNEFEDDLVIILKSLMLEWWLVRVFWLLNLLSLLFLSFSVVDGPVV